MKPNFPHRRIISLILQKIALTHLLSLSATISKLRRNELFRSLVLLAGSARNADRSTHELEYQFSASSSPLIHRHYYKKSRKLYRLRRFCAALCPCIYVKGGSSRWDDEDFSMDVLNECEPDWILMLTSYELEDDNAARVTEPCDYIGGFDDCVDEKAERFIARFYDEIRKQRRESSCSSQCYEGAVVELL